MQGFMLVFLHAGIHVSITPCWDLCDSIPGFHKQTIICAAIHMTPCQDSPNRVWLHAGIHGIPCQDSRSRVWLPTRISVTPYPDSLSRVWLPAGICVTPWPDSLSRVLHLRIYVTSCLDFLRDELTLCWDFCDSISSAEYDSMPVFPKQIKD